MTSLDGYNTALLHDALAGHAAPAGVVTARSKTAPFFVRIFVEKQSTLSPAHFVSREAFSAVPHVELPVWRDVTLRELVEVLRGGQDGDTSAAPQLQAARAAFAEYKTSSKTIAVSFVFPGEDNRPALRTVGKLSVDGPAGRDDGLTLGDMMRAPTLFQPGDLLLFCF